MIADIKKLRDEIIEGIIAPRTATRRPWNGTTGVH